MTDGFLDEATVDDITDTMVQVHATLLTMNDGGSTIVLSRWSNVAGDYVALAPQTVVLKVGDNMMQRSRTESAESTYQTGTISKTVPFDVEEGDVFAFGAKGEEHQAKVDYVGPKKFGRKTAQFTFRLGESG